MVTSNFLKFITYYNLVDLIIEKPGNTIPKICFITCVIYLYHTVIMNYHVPDWLMMSAEVGNRKQ